MYDLIFNQKDTSMKTSLLMLLSTLLLPLGLLAQPSARDRAALTALIASYSQARETQDTLLLRSLLMPEVDQLVSTGEWREGIAGSMAGMARSSAGNPGTRTLEVEKLRLLTPDCALLDARYTIRNPDGSARQMWSTFLAVRQRKAWKIAAIRNMLPAQP
jgi:uncharacterized protein (TIGR02246 family)